MACVYTVEKCQASGENRPYGFDWTVFLSNRWRANSPFALDARVRPSTEALQTGFEYNSSGGQTSGKKEPSWPKELSGTVTDGSIRWTAVAMSASGFMETIALSTWTMPAEITDMTDAVVDEAGRQATSVYLAGTTPGTYTVVNEITTTTGAEYQAIIELTIE